MGDGVPKELEIVEALPTGVKLLKWYYKQARPYEWRITKDPYKIWLSEVMLQQTQIKTIAPYYRKWIASLPNIQAVASSSVDDVLKLWEGLGYYNRAKNFRKACQDIINKHNGAIPIDPKTFQTLPGVGPYIAAAVMSIAFNIKIPSLDVNAMRVASRLFAVKNAHTKGKKYIIKNLYTLIEDNSPGAFNQAIMDLGREICTIANPMCGACPLSFNCLAHVNNSVSKYPDRMKKSIKKKYHVAVGIIWKKKQLLISKRLSGKLLGGMWEFPGGKIKNRETAEECIIREALEELDIIIKIDSFIKTIKHSYSHFSITMDAYHCYFVRGRPRAIQCEEYRWILPCDLDDFAFPSASHKLFDAVQKYDAI